VAEFAGDEAAAEHDEVPRLNRDTQDRVARMKRGLGQAWNVRDDGLCTCSDHHSVAAQANTVDFQLALADEAAVAFVHDDVGKAVAILPTSFGDRVDPTEHAVHDRRPIGPDKAGADAVLGCIGGCCRRLGDIGGIDQHLRGNAAAVQTGATKEVTFDDGDSPAVHLGRDQRVARAGADDDEVELLCSHISSLPGRAGNSGTRVASAAPSTREGPCRRAARPAGPVPARRGCCA
jgi:hypothetical protein